MHKYTNCGTEMCWHGRTSHVSFFLTHAEAVDTLTSGCRSHHLRRHKQDREQQKPLQSFETGPLELEGDAGVHVIQNASRQKSMPHSLSMLEIYPMACITGIARRIIKGLKHNRKID